MAFPPKNSPKLSSNNFPPKVVHQKIPTKIFYQTFSTQTYFPPVYSESEYLSFAQFTWSSLFSTFEVFTSMSSLLKQRNSFLKTKLDDAEHVLTLIKTDISL